MRKDFCKPIGVGLMHLWGRKSDFGGLCLWGGVLNKGGAVCVGGSVYHA